MGIPQKRLYQDAALAEGVAANWEPALFILGICHGVVLQLVAQFRDIR